MSNTSCLAGPAFSLTGSSYFTDKQVDFTITFNSTDDENSVKTYQWYLNNEAVPGQNQKAFSSQVPCGSHYIKARILTDAGWSGLKSLHFVTCEVFTPFNFTDQSGLNPGTLTKSDTITVPGSFTGYPISVSNGEYQINGGSWTSSSGTVNAGIA